MTTTGAPADMQVQRIRYERGSHIEPPLDEAWSDFDKLRWQAAVVKEDTGVTVRVRQAGFRTFEADLIGGAFGHPVGRTRRMSFQDAWYWMNTVSYAAEIGRYELKRSFAASVSPPVGQRPGVTAGLGLLSPRVDPNPAPDGAE